MKRNPSYKQQALSLIITIVLILVGTKAKAYDIEVKNSDGISIYYNYINDGRELEVTCNKTSDYNYGYTSDTIVIPEEVIYMNRARKVTSIGAETFSYSGLKSISIPNTVTSIGTKAFYCCRNLTSITIPNSVKVIGQRAFYECNALGSVHISDLESWVNIVFGSDWSNPLSKAKHLFLNGEEINNLVIPESVTRIESYAFWDCTSLDSVTIGDHVSYIGQGAFFGCDSLKALKIGNGVQQIYENTFRNCTSLTSLEMGNGVKTIYTYSFNGCTGLTSLVIGDSVSYIAYNAFGECSGLTSISWGKCLTRIGEYAFSGCSKLTTITIPNSVTWIEKGSFWGCIKINSVTIGNNVSAIDDYAFSNADSLLEVITKNANPPRLSASAFNDNTYKNASLFVPSGSINEYKKKEGWSKFIFIEEVENDDEPPVEPSKCEKPTISYKDGLVSFNCATEGVAYKYTITDSDVKSGSAQEVELGVTYNISVYATKEDYLNSDVVKATLCWIDVDPTSEEFSDDVVKIRANAVLIQTGNGQITVSGAIDGTIINIYNADGINIGVTTSKEGNAVINTNVQTGGVIIINIGGKTVKTIMQ